MCYTITSATHSVLPSVFQIAKSFGIFLFICHLALEGKRFPGAHSTARLTVSIPHYIHSQAKRKREETKLSINN